MRKSKVRGTLLTSLLSLLISFAMLVGSTFAWFTDTASTNVNKIQAGKLEIDLEVFENGQWVSAQDKMLSFQKAAGAETEEIIWEPGCTYELPKLRVVNKGNLAVKYQISITGINGDEKLNEVIDWTIGGQPINLAIETLAAETDGDEFVIKGHMRETAGNEYQGLSIDGITISVSAAQYTAEQDSFGDQYDAQATFEDGSASETGSETLENGREITSGTHTISKGIKATADGATALKVSGNDTEVTITGGEFDGGDGSASESGSETLENGREITSGTHTISKGIKATADGATALKVSGNGTEVTITGGEFDGGTNGEYCVWADDGALVKITGGTFTVGGSDAVIYASNDALVLISGGFFDAKSADLLDGNYTGTFAVTGGTFVNFDPSEYIRTDCEVVQEKKDNGDTWYKVQKIQTSKTELLRNATELNNYCSSIGCDGGACSTGYVSHDIEELFRADGYTCQGTINKIAWVGDDKDFKLTIQKVTTEADADLKITKTDGTVDYIKIILVGQQSPLSDSDTGADLCIMDDGIENVEFLGTSSWKCDSIDYWPGFSWDITNISAKS